MNGINIPTPALRTGRIRPTNLTRGLLNGEWLTMLIPSNEGKVCDAVVRALEKSTGNTRADVRVPDSDGIG